MARKRTISRRGESKRKKRITRRYVEAAGGTKFNRKTRKIIYKGFEARLPVGRVLALAGISSSTLSGWKEKGKDAESFPVHAAFLKKINRIQVGHEQEALRIIGSVARGPNVVSETKITTDFDGTVSSVVTTKEKGSVWQAAAWWLERRFPEDYGRSVSEEEHKTPEEVAAAIHSAADMMFNSVPVSG